MERCLTLDIDFAICDEKLMVEFRSRLAVEIEGVKSSAHRHNWWALFCLWYNGAEV